MGVSRVRKPYTRLCRGACLALQRARDLQEQALLADGVAPGARTPRQAAHVAPHPKPEPKYRMNMRSPLTV